MLTKAQKQAIENAAKKSGTVSLYKDTSMSGKSETLRYERRWSEMGRWGITSRFESHMLFSVKIHVDKDGNDLQEDIQKYAALCEEATALFNELRKENGQPVPTGKETS